MCHVTLRSRVAVVSDTHSQMWWEFCRALSQRDYLHTDKRLPLEEQRLQLSERIRKPLQHEYRGLTPRNVGQAMACAAFAQPHLSSTCDTGFFGSSTELRLSPLPPNDPPLIAPSDTLQHALSIPIWQLDELRDLVDRRVGVRLLESRCLHWMWNFFDAKTHPKRLASLLIPDLSEPQLNVQLVCRQNRIYIVVPDPTERSPIELYLPWERPTSAQHTLFDSRYVDPQLLDTMARTHGLNTQAARELLDRTVYVIPEQGADRFIHYDAWRARGLGALTDLEPRTTDGSSWHATPTLEDLRWKRWIRKQEDGTLTLRADASNVFDILATPRATDMTRALHCAVVALAEDTGFETSERVGLQLAVLDVERHLRRCLSPLIQWASSTDARTQIAAQTGCDVHTVVNPFMDQVMREWTQQLQAHWIGLPEATEPCFKNTLIHHLLGLRSTLHSVLLMPADARGHHTDIARLFCGFLYSDAPLQDLWTPSTASRQEQALGDVEDTLSQWFFGTWARVLDACSDAVLPSVIEDIQP